MRTETAVRTTASFFVFAYALLLLALTRCRMAHRPLPPPAWQRRKPKRPIQRISTAQAISALRANLWANALGLANKNGFAIARPETLVFGRFAVPQPIPWSLSSMILMQ